MSQAPTGAPLAPDRGPAAMLKNDIVSVRYQVTDTDRAVDFYTGHLGFVVEGFRSPAFASVALGNLRLLLGGPGSSGARPLPDGTPQGPGGWNRILIYVDDLEARIAALKAAGVTFRNAIEKGPGGSQILIADPDGNPIELHQAPG